MGETTDGLVQTKRPRRDAPLRPRFVPGLRLRRGEFRRDRRGGRGRYRRPVRGGQSLRQYRNLEPPEVERGRSARGESSIILRLASEGRFAMPRLPFWAVRP